jgi:hypothetical protein
MFVEKKLTISIDAPIVSPRDNTSLFRTIIGIFSVMLL